MQQKRKENRQKNLLYKLVASCNSKCYQYHNYLLPFRLKFSGLLGADGIILTNATDYIKIIASGAILQILGTEMMPFIRNYGNSFWSMFAMVGGFITNIVLDFIFVWIYEMGMKGAATATIAGQGDDCSNCNHIRIIIKKFYVYP